MTAEEQAPRRPPSLALRLTLLFGVVAVVVFSGFGWLIENSIERHFLEEDTKELVTITRAVYRAIDSGVNAEDLSTLGRRFDDILVGHHGASLYIADKNGRSLYASPGPDLSSLAVNTAGTPPDGGVREWAHNGHRFRALVSSGPDNGRRPAAGYTVVAALPIDFHLKFLTGFRHTLWLMVASGFAITSLMGWLAVRWGHAPLHDIINRIRHISANELNTRLSPQTVPAELTDLAVSFNEMLERMEQAFARLSNFSSDIAHDLRTPVTNMMTQTQVALSRTRSVAEYKEILYSNIEEYEHLARMINDMLFLAKADNEQEGLTRVDVDLAGETRILFEYYEAWAEERGVSLELEGSAITRGDRLMLRRALGNLLSNAIRHTAPGECVTVRLRTTENGETRISVENPGPDIPAAHIPKLFDRFYRIDPSRTAGGTGLGLAIAKSIVDAHAGKISVQSSGGRTIFRIDLPARPAQPA